MNPYIIIAALIALGVAFFGGWRTGAKVNEAHWQARELAIKEATDELRKVREGDRKEISRVLAEEVAKIQVVNRTINREVQRELREIPVYVNADCAIPPSGVRLLNESRGYSMPSGGGGAPKVPATTIPPRPATPPGRSVTGANRLLCGVPGVQCAS